MVFSTWTHDKACQMMDQNVLHSASLSVTAEPAALEEADFIIFCIRGADLSGNAKDFNDKCGGALGELLIEEDTAKAFKKAGSITDAIRVASSGKTQKVALLSLGSEDDEDMGDAFMTKLGSSIASKCNDCKAKKCAIFMPCDSSSIKLTNVACEFYSSLYSDDRFRTGDNVKPSAKNLESVSIITEGGVSDSAAADAAIEAGKAMASGIILTKDIVNAPHNVLNSESLANVARRVAEESGGSITCTILGKEECEKRGMGAYLGVARGSETDPQFIHLTYTPKSGNVSKKVGIVGKGVVFDTGGYNIKTAMMELMKFDCGGAAAVIGAAKIVGQLAPEGVEAHFMVAACENMINEKAYVPSDILTASNGKTIEVINTDAEGRLTMADALVYADKEVGCDSIIELSTLTGAVMVALGKKICGIWTSDDSLATDLADISKVTGEKSWRMPLEEQYNEDIKSKIADVKNCGIRWGGSITAALFLQHFVSDEKPFAHIDIAGPVWDDGKGATGFGAKMITEWISRQGKSE